MRASSSACPTQRRVSGSSPAKTTAISWEPRPSSIQRATRDATQRASSSGPCASASVTAPPTTGERSTEADGSVSAASHRCSGSSGAPAPGSRRP
ncbi:MAG: hypothetical protein IPN17_31855 [Deltaproteobacteria bacterium]|nr:hypothetical protein [Deltaproteobacteria bacterium]